MFKSIPPERQLELSIPELHVHEGRLHNLEELLKSQSGYQQAAETSIVPQEILRWTALQIAIGKAFLLTNFPELDPLFKFSHELYTKIGVNVAMAMVFSFDAGFNKKNLKEWFLLGMLEQAYPGGLPAGKSPEEILQADPEGTEFVEGFCKDMQTAIKGYKRPVMNNAQEQNKPTAEVAKYLWKVVFTLSHVLSQLTGDSIHYDTAKDLQKNINNNLDEASLFIKNFLGKFRDYIKKYDREKLSEEICKVLTRFLTVNVNWKTKCIESENMQKFWMETSDRTINERVDTVLHEMGVPHISGKIKGEEKYSTQITLSTDALLVTADALIKKINSVHRVTEFLSTRLRLG